MLEGSNTNPGFGSGFAFAIALPEELTATDPIIQLTDIWKSNNVIPFDLIMAAGSRYQRLILCNRWGSLSYAKQPPLP